MENALKQFYDSFIVDSSIADLLGFNPYYQIITSVENEYYIINNEKYLNLASNNYLGLANDIRVISSAKNAIEKYGVSMAGTPIATGCIDVYSKLTKRIADFVGCEDSVILPSCYQANAGLFTKIISKDDVVIIDQYAHSSLIEGVKAVGCKIKPFLHNDINSLSKLLNNSNKENKRRFVITESVFSTEGSIAPLNEINSLCNKFEAILIVDDSHGIGVIGNGGRGILSYTDIRNFNGIYTASLGKAIAASGGVICGNKKLIDYLRYYCSYMIYSTALPPAMLAAIDKILDIIEVEFSEMYMKIQENKKIIFETLIERGFNLRNSESPINAVVCGNIEETLKLAKRFYENKILVTPFIYPSVPYNSGVVRIIAGSNISKQALENCRNILSKL